MAYSFPELIFLQNQSAAQIHANMLSNIPASMDTSEGGFVWDLTYPTALEKAQAAEYTIPQAIMTMFPRWAEGVMLDLHAENRGITRKPAVSATGIVTFTGTVGTVVPAGTRVAISASGSETAISFVVNSAVTLASPTADAGVTAVSAGAAGNVAAGRINRIEQPVAGITAVSNAAATSGGSDTESDDALRSRILEYDSQQGSSYVGSVSDYRRWALEVSGIGGVKVIPASDGSGTVTLLVTDASGQAASDALQTAVYNHIISPDDPEARLAPINAALTVDAPEAVNISVAATLSLESGADIDTVKTAFLSALQAYFAQAADEGAVRYSHVGALLLGAGGVIDYSGFTLNDATANVTIASDQLPVTDADMISLTGV